MASPRAFQTSARLATITAALMYGLIVVGSIVRTTGSGLSCPDWPLCNGRLIPPFQINVFLEWFHRLIALGVGLLLFSTAAVILSARETRARLGGLAALAIALYFTQALLGALTVWKLLDPSIVSGHLAVGLLLFTTLLLIALVSHHEARVDAPAPAPRVAGLLPLFGTVTLLAYAQSVLGGMVSTNHAGLACPDWPLCNGELFPFMGALVALQVAHRWGAYVLTIALFVAAGFSGRLADPLGKRLTTLASQLVLVQIALGVANVFLGLPVWISALHLANATLILACMVTTTFRLAALTAVRPTLTEAGAR
jgi:cytochrome c oxidase assembly protein subunit 15